MNFHDPDRPRLTNGAPAFATDRLQGALPTLYIGLTSPSQLRLTVFLPSSQTRYRPQWLETTAEGLKALVEEYEDDPEAALRKWFDFDVEKMAEEATRPAVPADPVGRTDQSADDLGF